jgi:hypothetical protein
MSDDVNTSGMLTVLLPVLFMLFLQHYSRGMIMSKTVDSFFGLCGCTLFLVFDWWTWIYFMYILVSLTARYRVLCTIRVKGERSCLYACTCLLKAEMFRSSVCFLISRFVRHSGYCVPQM